MLREILTISGRPGLYRLVARGNNCLIVESVDGAKKRMPVQGTDKVVSLGDISIFTEDGEMRLGEVFRKIADKNEKKNIEIDLKKAANTELNSFFADIVPDYDRDKVYPSHIKKIIGWYNILIADGIESFAEEDVKEENNGSEKEQKVD